MHVLNGSVCIRNWMLTKDGFGLCRKDFENGLPCFGFELGGEYGGDDYAGFYAVMYPTPFNRRDLVMVHW
jgi:hypothetical protein